MSVLIKRMNMPKDCEKCDFAEWYNGTIYCHCIHYATIESDMEHLLSLCPLVDVPTPHGRLIDEDWLLRFISTNNSLGATHYDCLTKEEIQLAPTVIKGEK